MFGGQAIAGIQKDQKWTFGELASVYSWTTFPGELPRTDGHTPRFGRMYVMQMATVYVPDDLKRALTREAVARGISEAELIRDALRRLTSSSRPPRPRLPLFNSGKPRLAERVEQAVAGFGEH